MNGEQFATYLQALLAQVTISVIIPLMILFMLFGTAWYMLWLAQCKDGFNIEEVFLDESRKVSASRTVVIFAFAVSSWYLAIDRLGANPSSEMFLYYLIAWSSSLTLHKLADKWNGALPFAKGVSQ